MALPSDLNLVNVTGRFVDAIGNPCSGTVTFQLSNALYDRANLVVVEPTPIVATLNSGAINVSLPATDDPDLTPRNNYYTVTISLAGLPVKTFSMLAPALTKGSLDLTNVMPVVVSDLNPIYLQLRLDSMQDLNLAGLSDGYTIAWDAAHSVWRAVPAPSTSVQAVVLKQNGGAYPPRPTGINTVIYEGNQTPTDAIEGDVWIQTP